jgi:type IV pilus assembly protein PilE
VLPALPDAGLPRLLKLPLMHFAKPTHTSASRKRGFTLIEVMIVVSVIAVLSSIALPSFEAQLQKARRTDALISVMTIQSAQERYRSNNSSYGSLADIGVPDVSPSKHYALKSVATGPDGFEVIATAVGVQARGVGCRYMRLSSTGGYAAYASGQDLSMANDAAANHACWML